MLHCVAQIPSHVANSKLVSSYTKCFGCSLNDIKVLDEHEILARWVNDGTGKTDSCC